MLEKKTSLQPYPRLLHQNVSNISYLIMSWNKSTYKNIRNLHLFNSPTNIPMIFAILQLQCSCLLGFSTPSSPTAQQAILDLSKTTVLGSRKFRGSHHGGGLPGNWPFPFPVWHFLSRCWTLFPVWRDMDEYRNITYYSMYHVRISTILIPTKHPVVGSPRILPWNWPRLDVCTLDFRWSLRWLCCLPSFETIHRLKPRRGFQPDFWGKLISGSLNMI